MEKDKRIMIISIIAVVIVLIIAGIVVKNFKGVSEMINNDSGASNKQQIKI